MPEELSIKEAAEMLGVSERTVRRRIKDGSLPAKKKMGQYGQQWFILSSAIKTTQEITDVVEVKRRHDAQALSLAVVKAFDEVVKSELEAMKAEVAASREEVAAARMEIAELRQMLEDRRRERLWKKIKSFFLKAE